MALSDYVDPKALRRTETTVGPLWWVDSTQGRVAWWEGADGLVWASDGEMRRLLPADTKGCEE